jgi:hypothetical protein
MLIAHEAAKKVSHVGKSIDAIQSLGILKRSNARFNRRVGGEQLANATRNTKGCHAFG